MAQVFGLGFQFIENVEKLEITINKGNKTRVGIGRILLCILFPLRPFLCY